MLETIRHYSGERLEEAGEAEELRRRHGEYYLARATRLAEEPVTSAMIEGFREEHDNFRGALGWGARGEDGRFSLELCQALRQLWLVGGHLREGLGWVEDALDRTQDQVTPLRANALLLASDLFRPAGNYRQTSEVARESLALFEELGDRAGAAAALHELGELAHWQEDFGAAREWYEKAIAAARETGKPGIGSLNNLAEIALVEGDYDEARRLGEEVVSECRKGSSEYQLAVSLHTAGAAALGQGRTDEALQRLSESVELCLKLDFGEGCAWSLVDLAALHARREDGCRAARLLGASEAAREISGASLEPMTRQLQEEVLAMLETRLDASELADQWRAGRQMSVKEAADYALGSLDSAA